MAYDKNQKENALPVGDIDKKSEGFLPRYFRTDFNKKFLNATIDQFIKNGKVEKINDYIGRRHAKSVIESDTFLPDVSSARENYQLEPGIVAFDDLENVSFFKDYNDFINQLEIFGADVKNHNRLNQQEFYSWDPKIDLDKFVNFREYYWLPNGPDVITIVGQQDIIESTYTVTLGDDLDNTPYIFDPNGLTRNPSLTLYRGKTYRFEVDCEDAPLFFRTERNLNDDYDFANVVNNGAEEGIIEVTIDGTTPDTLWYVNGNDINQAGSINVLNEEDASFIDIVEEIVGKKDFKLSNGHYITNGMKLRFAGRTNPEIYQEGNWYVEGVGKSIELISDKDLEIPANYTDATIIPFDNYGFDSLPFSDQATFAGTKDYILINRGSPDKSQWSRYNRWFHRDVIEKSAQINGTTFTLDQNARAFKPIIEFVSGLKLYNYGTTSKQNIDLIDTFTNDAFSIIEGQQGYNIDGIDLTEGMRVIFTNDPDTRVRGKIYEVKFIRFRNNNQLTLVETEDTNPVINQTVLVKKGDQNEGTIWFYNGDNWIKGQEKTTVNQAPLFDLFDENSNSLSNTLYYPGTTFKGNKLFSYLEGTGEDDEDLGFPLSYRTIVNTGDIVFDYNYLNEVYNYTNNLVLTDIESSKTYLHKYNRHGNFTSENAWVKSKINQTQRVVREYFANIDQRNNFEIDVYDQELNTTDIKVVVFVNNEIKFENKDYNIVKENNKLFVRFNSDLEDASVILKIAAEADKNDKGVYEVPINLERNPNNDILPSFTFGEVLDHALSIVEESPNFDGIFPGTGNLRDLPDSIHYGKKVIQHSSPYNLAAYHLLDKEANIVKALRYAKREYAKFKRLILLTANSLGYDGLPKKHLDLILQKITENKTNTMPFYFSDMIAFKAKTTNEFTVRDSRIKNYPMSNQFNLDENSDKCVLVYIDNELLLHSKDYTFEDDFVLIKKDIQRGQTICIEEYESTNGSFVPPTPTKLGLYPLFEPKVFVDTTYQTPTKVIQGHDGSIVKAYDDYRDSLLLEFEQRIYNNIKVSYNTRLLDYDLLIQSVERKSGLNTSTLNKTLSNDFGQWLTFTGGVNYQSNTYYDRTNAFTYNYNTGSLFNGEASPGFWRAIYKYVYDTDRPHTHPWEMLGFTIEPEWWQDQYGPAPYTDGNGILWDDLSKGIIRKPGSNIKVNKNRIRSWLKEYLPVDEYGNLLSPLASGVVKNYSNSFAEIDYTFGDQAPVENAWRRSSEYPFALLTATLINYPHKVFAAGFDRSRQILNQQDQIIYKPTNSRIRLQDVIFPNKPSDTTKENTLGLINYIQNYLASKNQSPIENYQNTLSILQNRIVSKLGGFSNKDNFRLILDSRTPLNKGNVFIPNENYKIALNTSSPIKEVIYSGVIIEKTSAGYSVRGYDKEKALFNINPYRESVDDNTIVVGGVSETFSEWREINWSKSAIVLYNGSYYRALDNIPAESFNPENWARLPELPTVGGSRATIRKRYSTEVVEIPYGSVYETVQEVVDFLLGYGNYLESEGFTFDSYDPTLDQISNWKTSVKEFMFWTTQNWDFGSVITLSPGAKKLSYKNDFAVIDNLFDPFYGNFIFTADGSVFERNFLSTNREDNIFSVETKNTQDGIYFCKMYPVQKEHVLILDNRTRFQDYIYAPEMGYRQDRVKVLGYRTDNWSGGFNIPGFVYDDVKVTAWESYKDYFIGDTVKFKEFYYIANTNITGQEKFDPSRWIQLPEKPEAGLKPNWDYRTLQFGDFYDLDTDNFDSEQQKLAQHLIGYQKRQYLENIINDEVSQYKFYQGMIREKGTKNSLTKLFDNLIETDATGLKFYEEWAIRTGQYGAVDNFKEFELSIDESQYLLQPQPVKLTNFRSATDTSLTYKIPEADVYTKPADYTHAPFVLKNDYDQYLKDTGYVNDADITYTIKDIDEITTLDFTNITRQSYVWVANYKNDWDILKPSKLELNVTAIENVGSNVVFTTDKVSDIQVDDYIGISGVEETAEFIDDKLNRCFRVIEVGHKTFTVKSVAQAPETVSLNSIFVYKFVTQRTKDITAFNNNLNTNYLTSDDKVWIDQTETSTWKVVQNTNPFVLSQTITNRADYKGAWTVATRYNLNDIVSYDGKRYFAVITHTSTTTPDITPSQWEVIVTDTNTLDDPTFSVDKFAKTIVVGTKNQNMIVGAPDARNGKGAVYYYQRNSETLNYDFNSEIGGFEDYAQTLNIGNSIAISNDEEVIVIADPSASGVKTKYRGEFDSQQTYQSGDIVSTLDTLWLFGEDYSGDVSSDLVNEERSDILPIGYIPADKQGTLSAYTNQGVIFILKKTAPKLYEFVTAAVSRYPQTDEMFGKTVKIVKTSDVYELYVTAPGTNTNRIYVLEFNSKTDTLTYREDRKFKGVFSDTIKYYKDDIVVYEPTQLNPELVGTQLYKAKMNLSAGVFVSNNWELIDSDVNLQGYVPNNLLPRLNDDSTFLTDEEKDTFGDSFDVSADGEVLAVGITNYPAYDREATYAVGDIVGNNGSNYEAKTIITPIDQLVLDLGENVTVAPGTTITQPATGATAEVKNNVINNRRLILTNISGTFTSFGSPKQVIVVENYLQTYADAPETSFAPGQKFYNEFENGERVVNVLTDFTVDQVAKTATLTFGIDSGLFNTEYELVREDSSPVFSDIASVTVTNTDGQILIDDLTSSAPAGFWLEDVVSLPSSDTTADTTKWKKVSAEKVAVYRKNNSRIVLSETISSTTENQGFGSQIQISNDGKTLLIGAPYADIGSVENTGKIYVYKWKNLQWTLTQTIEAPQDLRGQEFGLDFTYTDNNLYVLTNGTYRFDDLNLDFTLDGSFTRFGTKNYDTTNLNIYEEFEDGFLYAGQIVLDGANLTDFELTAGANHVYVGLPYSGAVNDKGLVYDIRKQPNSKSWKIISEASPIVDTQKIKTSFVYNTRTKDFIGNVDYIDVLQGKIAAPLEQELDFKTYYDPAIYDAGNENVVVDSDQSWGQKFVGKTWWNLDSSKFYNPYQGDVLYKTNYWNKIFPGYAVEVCEWVETTLLPSEWNAISGTNAGFTQGVTGTTKYGDDVYATGRIYNPESESFSNKYYYWVANKDTLPTNNNYRLLTAREIAAMIEDPAGQGYRFVALLGDDEFAMYNMKNLFSGKENALNFSYYVADNTQTNIHTQYQIYTDGLETSIPNNYLEEKWFDSLTGVDKFFRTVPDRDLSEKQKYGTLNVPRQSMFKNRFEARKQFFERVNLVLNQRVIIDDYDFTALLAKDEIPNIKSNLYDLSIDTNLELANVSLDQIETATLNVTLIEGSISRVQISNPGKGYTTAPTVVIGGDGQNAELETVIENGSIVDIKILNKGINYNTISADVRPYTVLIVNDTEVNNKWSLYTYDYSESLWKKGKSQLFDNTIYWDYKDWYAQGYNELSSVDYTLPNTYSLGTIDDKIGNLIKIESVGTGGWTLLKKIDNTGNDISVDYQTVGRENGTIEFLNTLWDYSSEQIGFDVESYDTQVYDSEPVTELRNIFKALADNIFVDDLLIEWNQLFLASVRYAFTEQPYIDWAFKTSFVKAEHRLGELEQKISFQNDNLESYEDYVREVKPYKTKIREYLSTYEKVTNTNTLVTDFDIVARYDAKKGVITPPVVKLQNGEIFGERNITTTINQNWLENVGFEVTRVHVVDSGAGYTYTPKVTIEGNAKVKAQAIAYMRNGEIVGIEVTNPGLGYLTPPTVVVEDPTGDNNRKPRVVTHIGNSVIRSFADVVKFDRITSSSETANIEVTENLTAIDSQSTYNLKFEMDLRKSNISVLLDGVELLSSEYTYGNVEIDNVTASQDTYGLVANDQYYQNFYSQLRDGFVDSVGFIKLTTPPTQTSVLTVTYKKSANSLNIVDRINNFYKPESGMLGKDVSQLMDGIDYGGVEVSSFNFKEETVTGWDQSTWDTFAWSNYVETGEDFVFYTDGSTSTFNLPEGQILEQDQEYNVYIDGIRVDDPRFDGTSSLLLTDNPKAFMAPVVGDGSNTFTFPDVALFESFVKKHTQSGINNLPDAKIILRKSTSDGSQLPESSSYDTLLSGGDLAYSTASGLLAEDIVIDGDGFVTINTSKGPEEVVPGHVADTLDISVYHRPDDGGSIIANRTYYYDDSTTIFDIGFNPSSTKGCLVKVNNNILAESDFDINYKQRQISISTELAVGDRISIFTIDSGVSNILDIDNFTADGSTSEYITNVKYQNGISALVSVNGVTVPHRLFKTTNEYGRDSGLVGIEFGEPPVADDYIYYAILSSDDIPVSQINIQTLSGDGSSLQFDLNALPFTLTSPIYTNTLVSKDGVFLNQGYNKRFVVNNSVNQYQIDNWQIPTGSFDIQNAKVFLNNVLLEYEQGFLWDEQTNIFSLIPGVASNGDTLKIFILGEEEFSITTTDGIKLILGSAPATNSTLEVYTLGDDRNQLFERYHYDIALDQDIAVESDQYALYQRLKAGNIDLREKSNGAEYVWLFVNGKLQIPNYDYKLSDDKQTVIYKESLNDNDSIEVLEFAGDRVGTRFGYRIFKDITNRSEYKRLTNNRTYKLAQDLNYFDKNIVLNTTAGLTTPSKDENAPGVIYIDGERIEYFIKIGNTLRQIRRGTKGTGVKSVYTVDTSVIDQSNNHTVPYNDNINVTTYKTDDTTIEFEVAYVPTLDSTTLTTNWYRETIPMSYGQCNEIEVFVGGKRLRKVPHIEYDPETKTNITHEAEFSVNGYNYGTDENPVGRVRITNTYDNGLDVKIIKKTGQTWVPNGDKLANAEGIIPQFIRSTTQDLPE